MGSGGHSYIPRTQRQASDAIEAAKTNTQKADYEAEIARQLNDLKTTYNDRDTEKINDRLEDIKRIIADYLESAVTLRFGGSITKRTYIDGISDVDCLCFLNPSKFTSESPKQILEEFEAVLKRELGKDAEIERGNLSIKVKYKDCPELQILPSLRTASGVRIASAEKDEWSQVVHPD